MRRMQLCQRVYCFQEMLYAILLTLLVIWFSSEVNTGAVRWGEYCDTEVFRAECPEGDVIVLDSALYGRMRIGRCVEVDVAGYVGCFKDVIRMADRRCSGRRVCEIRIPDAEFEGAGPCLKELKTYLEAAYSCVTVEAVSLDSCQSQSEFDVTRSRGYLSSSFAHDLAPPCDATRQPWVIRGREGQQVRLTLYDFALDEDDLVSYANKSPSVHRSEEKLSSAIICDDLGTIFDSAKHRLNALCRLNNQRVQEIFESQGNLVKIWINDRNDQTRFLLKYEVVGCSDPRDLPAHAQFVRFDSRRGLVRCLYSDVTWSLNCSDDDNWTRSSAQAHCSPAAETDAVTVEGISSDQPTVTSVGVVVGLVITISLLLVFCLVLFCTFRHHRRKRSRDLNNDDELKRRRKRPRDSSSSWAHHQYSTNNPTTTTTTTTLSLSSSSSSSPMSAKSSLTANVVTVNGSRYEHLWRKLTEERRRKEDTQERTCNKS